MIVEDSEFDARILVNLLRQGGYEVVFQRVETAETLLAALKEKPWDVVLADYNLPTFNALAALRLLQESGLDLPFLIVSGGIGEDIAVAAMKAGAHDYLMKGNLARLVPAVERELREAHTRAERRQVEQALRESELRYRLLWENSADAVLLMDTDSNIHFANPAVEKVFGYAPEEVLGKNLTLLLPERLRPDHQETFTRYLRSGVADSKRRVMETVGRCKGEKEVLIEIALNDLALHGKRWFVAFIRDITERKRAEKELRQHQETFEVARRIQQRLFPKAAPDFPPFDIAGASYPAEAAGGDYFDYLKMIDGCLAIVIADVTGHGVGPALLMAETRAYLRVLTRNREDVGEILTRASRILAEDVDFERYVTLQLTKFDQRTRSLIYTSAGHPTGYVLDRACQVKALLKRTGVPLGLQPDARYTAAPPVALAAGDIVLMLTDGIEEAMSPADEFFGSERLFNVVRQFANRSAKEIVEAIYQSVRSFSGNRPPLDDLTMVVVKVG
ncbi:MAG: SpoIIE family protein phosphatase [Verrucomicrobia bacterium]|nr:SpoIIE family protein phosphatase [Verrucomicrobiota bacterium]